MNQKLIDFCNEQIALVNIVITAKGAEKLGVDASILQATSNIDNYNNQKAQLDIDIADYEQRKNKIKEIITILSS